MREFVFFFLLWYIYDVLVAAANLLVAVVDYSKFKNFSNIANSIIDTVAQNAETYCNFYSLKCLGCFVVRTPGRLFDCNLVLERFSLVVAE